MQPAHFPQQPAGQYHPPLASSPHLLIPTGVSSARDDQGTSSGFDRLLQANPPPAHHHMQQPTGSDPYACFQQGSHMVQETANQPGSSQRHFDHQVHTANPTCRASFESNLYATPFLEQQTCQSHSGPEGNPDPNSEPLMRILLPGSSEERLMTEEAARACFKPFHPACGHCGSTSTRFRYFNNKKQSIAMGKIQQPHYLCKACQKEFTYRGEIRKRKDLPANEKGFSVPTNGDQLEFKGPARATTKRKRGKGNMLHDFLVHCPSFHQDFMHTPLYNLTSQGMPLPHAGYPFLQDAGGWYHQCPTQQYTASSSTHPFPLQQAEWVNYCNSLAQQFCQTGDCQFQQVQMQPQLYAGNSNTPYFLTYDSASPEAACTASMSPPSKIQAEHSTDDLFTLEQLLNIEQPELLQVDETMEHTSSSVLLLDHPSVGSDHHRSLQAQVQTQCDAGSSKSLRSSCDSTPKLAPTTTITSPSSNQVVHSNDDGPITFEETFKELEILVESEPIYNSPAPTFDQPASTKGLFNYHQAPINQPAPHHIWNTAAQQDSWPPSALHCDKIAKDDVSRPEPSPARTFDQPASSKGSFSHHQASNNQPAPGVVTTYCPPNQIQNSAMQQDGWPPSALPSQRYTQCCNTITEDDASRIPIHAQPLNEDFAYLTHVNASSENVELEVSDMQSHAHEVLEPPYTKEGDNEQQQQQSADRSPHSSQAMHNSNVPLSNPEDIAVQADKHAEARSPTPGAQEPHQLQEIKSAAC